MGSREILKNRIAIEGKREKAESPSSGVSGLVWPSPHSGGNGAGQTAVFQVHSAEQ